MEEPAMPIGPIHHRGYGKTCVQVYGFRAIGAVSRQRIIYAKLEACQITEARRPSDGLHSYRFELPGEEVLMRREGDRLVIELVRPRNVLAFLRRIEPFDGDFPAIDDPPPAVEKIF
jgi:antitoxin VapB